MVLAVLFSPALFPVWLSLSRPLQLVVVSRPLSGPAWCFLSFGGRGLGGPLLSPALSGLALSWSSTSVGSPIPRFVWSGSVFLLFWRSLSWQSCFLSHPVGFPSL